ncbi:dihydrofolate reductase [Alcaligenes sp. SDU_A2]|uniref:dihydrofolate reductase n=1 Tax=Alcaligenes sp. SDU_A2 TaxID=3136634 RepID=UPI002CEFFCCF|nr:dihydrofolate reductase [Alcaligenes sp.]HRL28066.1 dihydrofolate reductase [Alcaligenes sp.]
MNTLPAIRLVVAYAANRCIGKDNTLPWRLPSDLQHFKRVTMGLPIIMGRKTWESLGRPLPGRPNIVISRNTDYAAPGAQVFSDLHSALHACADFDTACVIGGEQIFALALPQARELIATEIHSEVQGDTFFPALADDQWTEVERLPQPPENGLSFDFVTYRRKV